jgi:hypothetical protein
LLTTSLTRNLVLNELNLSGNQIFCRYDTRIKSDPSILIIGKEALVYKLFLAAATNQALKIFRVKMIYSSLDILSDLFFFLVRKKSSRCT